LEGQWDHKCSYDVCLGMVGAISASVDNLLICRIADAILDEVPLRLLQIQYEVQYADSDLESQEPIQNSRETRYEASYFQ
jgi:hypothetical protein